MSRPIGIDLFAGVGGLSLGFEQAGFDIVAAVEIDPVHSATHLYNFPHCTMLTQSVSALTGKIIRRAAKLENKEIDVVFGGPPCQGFSLIGHRSLDDPRNILVSDYLRLVHELEAKYFVFENVKGITVGRHRKFLEEFIESANSLGYEIRLPWKVLNASHFGVPQNRERLILIGAKKNLKLPGYPLPHTRPAGSIRPSDLVDGPTCHDALGDIPNAERFSALDHGDSVNVTSWKPTSEYAQEMHCLNNKSWHFGIRRNWIPSVLTSSRRTEHSPISRSRFLDTADGTVEPISRFFKLPKEGVSNTLRAGTDSARGAFTSPRPIHYKWPRCITVREMARLHGFPDWFRFHETKWHGGRQVGNAVPPPLGRAVASELIKAMGIRPSSNKSAITLGDPELLRLNMAGASRYFGIQTPITRRDRKSGAKKRKQTPMNAKEAALMPRTAELEFKEMMSV